MKIVHPAKSRAAGFSLIEVLVVMAIAAILVSVALPSYLSHVARARRADARAQLMQAAGFMQRFYTANDNYAKDRAGNDVIDQMPAAFKQSPADTTALYQLEIPNSELTSASYEIRMVPITGAAMSNDKCGTFSLTSTGARRVIVGGVVNTSDLRDLCWK